jgi:NaMN:DMB phosphoribosyltransferase
MPQPKTTTTIVAPSGTTNTIYHITSSGEQMYGTIVQPDATDNFTKRSFETALRQASRPVTPSRSDSRKK